MNESQAATIRVGQFIVMAMAGGVAAFAVVAAFVGPGLRIDIDAQVVSILLYVLAAMTLGAVGGQIIVRHIMLGQLRPAQPDEPVTEEFVHRLLKQTFFTIVVCGAMLEACGLFGGVICLLTGRLVALVAAGVAVLGLLLLVPTQAKFARLLSDASGQQWP